MGFTGCVVGILSAKAANSTASQPHYMRQPTTLQPCLGLDVRHKTQYLGVMSQSERNMVSRAKALELGSKRYSIMLGPDHAAIVARQAKVWGSNNEVFRQALVALENITTGTHQAEAGHSFLVDRDHSLTVEPVGNDQVKMTFSKGERA